MYIYISTMKNAGEMAYGKYPWSMRIGSMKNAGKMW